MLSSHSGIIGNNADQQSYGDVFDAILESTAKQLMSLPFEAREPLIESFSTLLLRGFVPMSGMTVQQHISADQKHLDQLNVLMQKKEAYKNGTDARYVYQFAREATSAGIVPAYIPLTRQDANNGEFRI
jgi:hypothetical protein